MISEMAVPPANPDPSPFRRLVDGQSLSDGSSLSELDRALIALGLAASVTSLDRPAIESALTEAFRAGASPTQVQEVVSVVSGLGVHSLMVTAVAILESAGRAGFKMDGAPTDAEQALWAKRVGDDPFWQAVESELPGFLRALLRLSPDQFEAFFEYCAVPWKSGAVSARVKELLAMASDATPAHRFMPGFRLHLANAIKLGAGRRAVLESLALAEAAPAHRGID
jgi:alkylhydroperoxidase/carboxymuconolactone decarboxylase family protein YurZ